MHAAFMFSGPRAFHVMAKPIGARCNLACRYCYYLEKDRLYPDARKPKLADDVLERFIANYMASQTAAGARHVWFAWQGGEPMLLGRGYFERVLALQSRHCPAGTTVSNALQTNGTLIDADWARFLHDNGFLVGISIDGPDLLHDRYRVDRRGRASSTRVLAGLGQLQNHRVDYNVLTAVSRQNARHPLQVYRYLRGLGVEHIQFIPVVERLLPDGMLAGPPTPGDDGLAVAPWSVTPREYGRFLTGVFDEWLRHDVGGVFIQVFDLCLALWLGRPASLCSHAETCGTGLALEHNGDLYACDHYVYPEFRLGNILDTPLTDLANQPRQWQFGTEKQTRLPASCRTCRWKFACQGGCPKHRFLPVPGGDPFRRNYFCESQQIFLAHAAPYLAWMARLVRSGQPAARIMQDLAKTEPAGRNAPCPCGSGRKFKLCCGPTAPRA